MTDLTQTKTNIQDQIIALIGAISMTNFIIKDYPQDDLVMKIINVFIFVAVGFVIYKLAFKFITWLKSKPSKYWAITL
jgi:hypothetical protein